MDVGQRLRFLREERGYSQNMLADFAGVSQTHLRRVELGEADVTVNHLRLICDALGVSLKEFFDAESPEDELTAAVSSLSPRQKSLLVEFLKSL